MVGSSLGLLVEVDCPVFVLACMFLVTAEVRWVYSTLGPRTIVPSPPTIVKANPWSGNFRTASTYKVSMACLWCGGMRTVFDNGQNFTSMEFRSMGTKGGDDFVEGLRHIQSLLRWVSNLCSIGCCSLTSAFISVITIRRYRGWTTGSVGACFAGCGTVLGATQRRYRSTISGSGCIVDVWDGDERSRRL